MIKKTIIIVLSVLVLFFSWFYITRYFSLKRMAKIDRELELRDSMRIVYSRTGAYRSLEMGCIIAYTGVPNNEFDDLLFQKYGITRSNGWEEDKLVAKPIMDSVIFKKYGTDFYARVRREADSIENIIPHNYTIDGFYIFVESKIEDKKRTIEYVFQELRRRKLIPLKQNPCFPRELLIDYVVDTTGRLKRPLVMLKYNPIIDSTVLDIIKHLPFNWTPGLHNNKKAEFREQLLFKFAKNPYRDNDKY